MKIRLFQVKIDIILKLHAKRAKTVEILKKRESLGVDCIEKRGQRVQDLRKKGVIIQADDIDIWECLPTPS